MPHAPHPPTTEQTAIISAAKSTKDNLMINAYAGTGKTTALEMIESVAKEVPILYLVFNKRNADEAEGRMRSTTTVRTLNSCGSRIWTQACGVSKLKLSFRKTGDIFRALVDASPKSAKGEMWSVYNEVTDGVNMAKALGYVPEGKFPTAHRLIEQGMFHASLDTKPDDFVSDLIDAVLTESIKQSYNAVVDFNDQLYMPALFGGTFPKFPLTMVDEFQDLSPVNHALVTKLVGDRRMIGVGDRLQNIYGFRGAKAAGMDDARDYFACNDLALSVCFRCPQAIVEAARWHAPDFQWIKSGGHVETLNTVHGPGIHPDSAILCRNNAPLFRTAFQLLAAGLSVSVAGSDIGPKLIAMMGRLGYEDMKQAAVLSAIDDWYAEREAKGSKLAYDYAECMKVFARHGKTLSQALSYAEHLFSQQGSIQLLTGHKAKGLEFQKVYILDQHLCDMTNPQDQNLLYVMQTRAQEELYYIDSRNIVW